MEIKKSNTITYSYDINEVCFVAFGRADKDRDYYISLKHNTINEKIHKSIVVTIDDNEIIFDDCLAFGLFVKANSEITIYSGNRKLIDKIIVETRESNNKNL